MYREERLHRIKEGFPFRGNLFIIHFGELSQEFFLFFIDFFWYFDMKFHKQITPNATIGVGHTLVF